MLIGDIETKVTEKNRIALPKKFRDELQGQLILARGYENCLLLVDQSRWDKLVKLLTIKPLLNLSIRDTRRFIVGGAHEIELDSQGRFVLPQSLKDYADISTDVMCIGLLDWLEVWSKNLWSNRLELLKKQASDIADKLIEAQ